MCARLHPRSMNVRRLRRPVRGGRAFAQLNHGLRDGLPPRRFTRGYIPAPLSGRRKRAQTQEGETVPDVPSLTRPILAIEDRSLKMQYPMRSVVAGSCGTSTLRE